MTDKPTAPNATLADLETEGKPEPFVLATKGGKRVTFPDLFEMEFEAGEKFLADVENSTNSAVLERWLSEKDYQTLRDEKLTLRQIGILLQKVMNHYQPAYGDQAKGDASAS